MEGGQDSKGRYFSIVVEFSEFDNGDYVGATDDSAIDPLFLVIALAVGGVLLRIG